MEVAAPCPHSPDEQGLYVLPIDPVFEVRGRFRGYQTQETLAHDVFSFSWFRIMWGFFSGLRPLADSVCVRTFLYLCPVLKPAQMLDSHAQTN
jgi:hypothetical protein